jgi:hypothetical protein
MQLIKNTSVWLTVAGVKMLPAKECRLLRYALGIRCAVLSVVFFWGPAVEANFNILVSHPCTVDSTSGFYHLILPRNNRNTLVRAGILFGKPRQGEQVQYSLICLSTTSTYN